MDREEEEAGWLGFSFFVSDQQKKDKNVVERGCLVLTNPNSIESVNLCPEIKVID